MTNPNLGRPQLSPELIEVFAAYYRQNRAWGSLHIVLDDLNLGNDHVQGCIRMAKAAGDKDGLALGIILKGMTRSQRFHVARRAEKLVWSPSDDEHQGDDDGSKGDDPDGVHTPPVPEEPKS